MIYYWAFLVIVCAVCTGEIVWYFLKKIIGWYEYHDARKRQELKDKYK